MNAPKKTFEKPKGRPLFADAETAKKFEAVAKQKGVDRSSKTPLWVQIKRSIEGAIHSGALPEGSRLPSEQVICEAYGVSRAVTRSALAALTAAGLVRTKARSGMHVAAHPPEMGFMTKATSVFEEMSAKGHNVDVETFDFAAYAASAVEQRALGLKRGQRVLRILRVYRVDGEAITHTAISLPAHRLPGMEELNMEGKSVFGTILERYGLRPQRADRWIRATNAPADVAERMSIAEGKPLLQIESVAFDHEGQALEYYDAYYDPAVSPLHISTDNTGNGPGADDLPPSRKIKKRRRN